MNPRSHEDALGGRWSLDGVIPLAGGGQAATWYRARRESTGERVVLLVVTGGRALETADAARRVALLEDPRLLPIREVAELESAGPDDEGTIPLTVVELDVPPAAPLAALLGAGPLRAETARSVIGEAASAVETARRRGIRHQHLDSNRLFVDTAAGTVTVLGTGIETAAQEDPAPDAAQAARTDVLALTGLLYRGLTGRGPQYAEDGTVLAPSAVTTRRIPPELDALCADVLGDAEDAPGTVRELIEQLKPWQSIPVTLEAYDAADAGQGTPPVPARSGAVAAGVATGGAAATGAALSSSDTGADANVEDPEVSEPDLSETAPSGTAAPAPATGDRTTGDLATEQPEPATPENPEPQATDEEPAADSHPEVEGFVEELHLTQKREASAFPAALAAGAATVGSAAASSAAAGTAHEPAGPTPEATGDHEPAVGGDPESHRPSPSSADSDSEDADAENFHSTYAYAGPDSAPDSGSGSGERDSESADLGPVPITVPAAPDPEPSGPIIVPGRSRAFSESDTESSAPERTGSRSSLLRDVVGVAIDDDNPGTYALGPSEEISRSRQTQWILAGAVLLVLLAMVFALTSITSGLREQMANPLGTGGATPSSSAPSSAAAKASPSATAAPKPSPTAAAAEPPRISGVQLVAGSGNDHPEQAGRVMDGDTASTWKTRIYKSAAFGGLKQGTGLKIDLASPTTVSKVVVTSGEGDGGTVELHAANSDGTMGPWLAAGTFHGAGDVTLTPAKPLEKTGSVIVWIPQLPVAGKGYRAEIAEIRVE